MLNKLCLTFVSILLLCFCITIFGNESSSVYFPSDVGSYWVYEDQDGNEISRESVEDEVIPVQTFHAISYEPAIEEWFDYIPHLQPNRFYVDDDGITFYNSNEIAELIKARLTREIETLILMEPPDDAEISYEVITDSSEQYLFLPLPISLNEEWDTSKLKTTLQISVNDHSDNNIERMDINFSVIESGTVVDRETVETPAGTFEECIKIEFRTETEMSMAFERDGNPPGETVTTLWLAPNVGIVKCHREMEDMFLKTAPIDEIPFTTTENTLELKKYEIKLTETEANTNYFPVSPGSYWVYVDQDGNELTRRALENEVIPEKRLKAFNYKPAIENWEEYNVYMNPELYEVADDGIVLHVGDSAAKGLKARLKKELDVIEGITNRLQESMKNDTTTQEQRGFELKYEVDVKSEESLQFLPDIIQTNEEWDVTKFEAKIDIQYFSTNTQNRPINRPLSRNIWDITIIETGKIVGRESIETTAGKFNDCLKVEFRTETTMNVSDRWQSENIGTPGETISTLWIAPHIGIVKFHKKSENILLKALSKSAENEQDITEADIEMFNSFEEETLELKEYEIKTVDVNKDNKN